MSQGTDDPVRVFLRDLYGAEPQPLRSYLTQAEAKELIAAHFAGRSLFSDLDTAGYGGRVRLGVEDAIRRGLDPKGWDFWHAARLAFLEYGGCYKPGMEPPPVMAR